MRNLALSLLGACALAACSGCSTTQTAQSVEYVCASATATLRTITALHANLSEATRARVTQAVTVINPVCSQEQLPTLDATAHAALSGALTVLASAAAEAQR